MVAPFTNLAGSEHRNATTFPKSAGSPIGPEPPRSIILCVAWEPGHARFSVMPAPSAARSVAAVLAHARKPVRATFDNARVGIGCTTEYDVMQQMRPHPPVRM